MQIPDGIILAIVGVLSGCLGFLFRSVMELRTRVAVLERAHAALDKIESKLDRIAEELAELKGGLRAGAPK